MPTTSGAPVQKLDENIRARLIGILREYGVARAGIFGSFARGEQTPESDLDLVIALPANATLFTLSRLGTALEEVLGHPVDLITFNALETSARPLLRAHILHDLEFLPL